MEVTDISISHYSCCRRPELLTLILDFESGSVKLPLALHVIKDFLCIDAWFEAAGLSIITEQLSIYIKSKRPLRWNNWSL